MHQFSYSTPASLDEAIALLDERSRPLAGGTDLVPRMQEHLAMPERLVSLRKLDLRGIKDATNGLCIGAGTTLTELERDPRLRDGPYRALAQAARSAAAPQLRNLATIGGNLLQEPRCSYYRGPFNCWLKGGAECYARAGEHHAHALFQQSPCVAPQPSDPATALLALGATVELVGPDGRRLIELLELLVPPSAERRALHTLGQSELIGGVVLPPRDGWRSSYQKAMERATYSFALAGVAVALKTTGRQIVEARIALGGVANTPLLAQEAARSLIGKPLTAVTIAEAAELAAVGAQPLPQTAYKQELAVRLTQVALEDCMQ
jgi:xanthine dehydrogenase YagS FAD-binding subunit